MDAIAGLSVLRDALDGVHFDLDLPGSRDADSSARRIVRRLDDHVLPRLRNLEAPMLAVVGGSTGAGKSTLVNTLIGRPVSQTGVIRPTTTSPVLVYNPSEEHWFADDRILPGLERTRSGHEDQYTLRLAPEPTLPPGLAILDAPDIDSVVADNRRLSAQLLDAADMWMFVTSAARYADAVPWEFLKEAASRGAFVCVVVDRVPPAAMRVVPADLGRMMTDSGLADSPLFAVPETVVNDRGLLPDQAVRPIRTYLATLASNNAEREKVVRMTLEGTISQMLSDVPAIISASQAQSEALAQLEADATASFQEASRAVAVGSSDGTLLRGEVLTRWHDYVGTTDIMRSLDKKVSALRDRLTGILGGRARQGEELGVAAGSGLEALVREHGAAATERAWNAWHANPAGRQILRGHDELQTPSPEFDALVGRAIREWQSDVLDLVRNQGSDKRKVARIAALGVNGVGAALMLVIFLNTGGLSGAEGGVAVGTTVVAQRLLESIFGDEAVRKLAKTAKENLDSRVEALMSTQLARYLNVVAAAPSDDQTDELVAALEAARRGAGVAHEVATGELVDATPALPACGADELDAMRGTAIADPEVVTQEVAR